MISKILSKYRQWIMIASLFILITTIFYGVYYKLYGSLDIIYKAWDGPSYVVVAKSLYDPKLAVANNIIHSVDINEKWTWLPAHFPAMPLLIRAFSFIGFFQAMIVLTLLSSLAATLALYEFFKAIKITKHPFWLTLPFLFLSPRWFIVSHTGSSEPLFMALMLVSFTFFTKKNMVKSAIFAALCMLVRPQGVFLGLGYGIVALIELIKTRQFELIIRKYIYYLLIPVALVGVFTFYYFRTGDFFAFFSAIALFKHFQFSLFPTFNFPAANVETFWQEINALMFVLAGSACLMVLRRRVWWLGVISLTFLAPLLFMQHSDISRYLIPLLPVMFVAYQPILERKSFIVGVILMAPAIMRYALNFLHFNHAI
ncbi:MAG: hypothetical protein WCL07_00205 [bacterium]